LFWQTRLDPGADDRQDRSDVIDAVPSNFIEESGALVDPGCGRFHALIKMNADAPPYEVVDLADIVITA